MATTASAAAKGKKPGFEWADMKGKFFGYVAEVPKEFETVDDKLKELHKQLDNLVQKAKKYGKSLQSYSGLSVTVSGHLTELGECFDSNSSSPFVSFIKKIADIQLAAEQCHIDFKDKVSTKLLAPTEDFVQEKILPAREAKRLWQRARVDYNTAKTKLDQFLASWSVEKVSSHLEPQKLSGAELHLHLARLKEQRMFEAACDALGDTLWMRDFKYFLAQAELIMELHDCILTAYSYYYDAEKANIEFKKMIEEKQKAFKASKQLAETIRLKTEADALDHHFDPLVEILSASDLGLLNALCITAGTDQDAILTSVIRILDAYKKTLPIITSGIATEVAQTQSATTLFRANSVSTKLMTAYTKMTGQAYLRKTIQSLVHEVVANPTGYEVDKTKAPNEDMAANTQKLLGICQRFLDAILASINSAPLPFRIMAFKLQEEVVKRFPGAKQQAVAGFIFLRFFCPAILGPEANGLIDKEPDEKVRRPLVLISKVIQNLANGITFGGKEPYMVDCNPFIQNHLQSIQTFLDTFAIVPPGDYEPLCTLEVAKNDELPKLHIKIVQNLEKIGKCLYQYQQQEIVEPLVLILGELGDVDVEIQRDKDPKGSFFG